MFPYSVKYTESESDIQNIDLLYKIKQKCQNTFGNVEKIENFKNKINFLCCIIYNLHNSYFEKFVIWGFLSIS